MNYFLLADTEFFRRINEAGDCNMETAYMAFANQVIELCSSMNTSHAIIALAYIEIELQHHPMRVLSEERKEAAAYIGKALSFVRKMQKFLTTPQVPPLSYLPSSAETPSDNPAPPLQWTGNAIDLVELIYGIYEMGCFYIDIKRRKTISHTHFLEQMQERLNERIRRDEEAELKRR